MKRLFRGGAAVMMLFGAVHLMGQFREPTPGNETERTLFELMQGYSFALPGARRTMSDLLSGFSLMMSVQSAALGVVGWLIQPERRLAVAFALATAAGTAVSVAYFFVIPTAFLAVAALLFALAAVRG